MEAAAAASASPGPENGREPVPDLSLGIRVDADADILGHKAGTKPAKVMRPVAGSAFAAKSAERTSAGGTMRKLARTARNSDSLTAPSPSASKELNARLNAAEPPSNFCAILSTMSSRIAATSPSYVATSLAGLGFPWRLPGIERNRTSPSSCVERLLHAASRKVR